MSDFDALFALTDAADVCNANARAFIRHYREVPEWSNVDGYHTFAAPLQAAEHLRNADTEAKMLEEYIRRWDSSCNAIWWVQRAVGLSRPPFSFDGQTHATAHEAARYLAQAVVDRHRQIEGFDDFELSDDLASKMDELATVVDFYGFIQQEHHAADEIVPFDVPEAGEATEGNRKRGRPKGSKSENRLNIEREIRDGVSDEDIVETFEVQVGYVQKIRRELNALEGPAPS